MKIYRFPNGTSTWTINREIEVLYFWDRTRDEIKHEWLEFHVREDKQALYIISKMHNILFLGKYIIQNGKADRNDYFKELGQFDDYYEKVLKMITISNSKLGHLLRI